MSQGGGGYDLISIGFGDIGIFDKKYERTILQIAGTIIVGNRVTLGPGSRLCVLKEGTLYFSGRFHNSARLSVVCGNRIYLGDYVIASWDVLLIDDDFHSYIDTNTGKKNLITGKITIGNNVWLCARSVILKNSVIPNDSIVSAGTIVNSRFEQNGIIISSPKSAIIKSDVKFCG